MAEARRGGNGEYGQRVATAETQIAALASSLAELHRELSAAKNQIDEMRQTRWSSIWPAVAIGITLAGGVGTMYLAPLQRDVLALQNEMHLRDASMESATSAIEARVSNNEKNLPQLMRQMLAEYGDARDKQLGLRIQLMDTKRAWLNEVGNVERTNTQRFIALLWEKVFGEKLPATPSANMGPQDNRSDQ